MNPNEELVEVRCTRPFRWAGEGIPRGGTVQCTKIEAASLVSARKAHRTTDLASEEAFEKAEAARLAQKEASELAEAKAAGGKK